MEIRNNNLTDYIKIFDEVLPKTVHANFLKYLKYEDKKFHEARVQGGKDNPDHIQKNIRDSFVWFPKQLECSMSECHWTSLLAFYFKFKRYS